MLKLTWIQTITLTLNLTVLQLIKRHDVMHFSGRPFIFFFNHQINKQHHIFHAVVEENFWSCYATLDRLNEPINRLWLSLGSTVQTVQLRKQWLAMVMVRFSVPNSYTNYRPSKLPLLLVTWCETKYYTNHQLWPWPQPTQEAGPDPNARIQQ